MKYIFIENTYILRKTVVVMLLISMKNYIHQYREVINVL